MRLYPCLLTVLGAAPALWGQTTQGTILGRVADAIDRRPVAATLVCEDLKTSARFQAVTDPAGYYSFPSLPPAVYRLTVDAGAAYRSAQVYNLELPVAGFLEQNFALRRITDLWQARLPRSAQSRDGKTVLRFYGPDVDTSRWLTIEDSGLVRGKLEPSLSEVVDSSLLDSLPLAGRDVYALLVLQPGVTNDTSTLRGLGFSVNGQRPSSGSFLLDGVENNDYLITGPLAQLPPEAIQEYRISTNNFSAEYGSTSGYLANAVSRSGSNSYHGVGYFYAKNEALDANDIARKSNNQERLPLREEQPGFQLGGPLLRDRLFQSTSLEYLRQQSWADAQPYLLPSAAFVAGLSPGSAAADLFARFAPPRVAGTGQTAVAMLRQPDLTERWSALERLDWQPSATQHLMGRLQVSRASQPDFVWSPYPQFTSGLNRNVTSLALAGTLALPSGITAELHASFAADSFGWRQANPQVPRLQIQDSPLLLPGSPGSYFFVNDGKTGQLSANLLRNWERHFVKVGGGLLWRRTSSTYTYPTAALTFTFPDLDHFASAQPSSVDFAAAREAYRNGGLYQPDQPDRQYRYPQASSFAQDSFRLTPSLTLHFGVRYEYFGPPSSVGPEKDWLIGLGPGPLFANGLTGASLTQPGAGAERLYASDRNNFAARTGFAWNLSPSGSTILRGAYGIYYDRPFDNLWLNLRFNNSVPASATLAGNTLDYLHEPLAQILNGVPISANTTLLPLTLYQPGIRTPYVQSFFAALEQVLSENWSFELSYAGSLGRELLTTDKVNRTASICFPHQGDDCRYNHLTLDDDIDYRANQGASTYHALIASTRFRAAGGQFQVSYTWSHSIDNQSEPLAGLSPNLEVTNSSGAIQSRPAGFTAQFDSRSDRGNSDFDQRHNLVFYSFWDLPQPRRRTRVSFLERDWKLSLVGAVRSGTPYTIYAGFSPDPILYNRANLVDPAALSGATGPVDGGVRLLNPSAFGMPAPGKLGTAARNAFAGPGLFNMDLSLSRTFRLPKLGESGRLTLRADAYNAFNHANLNNPAGNNLFWFAGSNSSFAVAQFGRQDQSSPFPAVSPLNETARQIQAMIRVTF